MFLIYWYYDFLFSFSYFFSLNEGIAHSDLIGQVETIMKELVEWYFGSV